MKGNLYHNHQQSQNQQSSSYDLNPKAQSMLNYEQVQRLIIVVEEPFEVNGRGNFPTIKLCLRQLIKSVTKRMNEKSLKMKQVKMNGGAASHILASCNLPYSDIDLIFDVDFAAAPSASTHFDTVKEVVMDALIEYLPNDVNKDKITTSSMKDAYVRKMVRVNEAGDSWSLITLNNLRGRYVELKFVERMRRQFEFSVDSFQIHLDSLIAFDDHRVTPKFYPTVAAESVYGDFRVALKHLNERLIDTVQPELIRGGGLLKYVQLLVRGYRPARSPREFRRLERYMCSRYFIDFNTVEQQERKLRVHLDNHLHCDSLQTKYDFLLLLYQIVDESTVCLMNHERRMSLSLIEQLAYEVEMELYYQDQMNAAAAMAPATPHSYSPAHQKHRNNNQQHYHKYQQHHQNQPTYHPPPTPTPSPTPRPQQQQQQGNNKNNNNNNNVNTNTTLDQNNVPNNTNNENTNPTQQQVVEKSSSNDKNTPTTPHQPKQTILFVPHNASYWIPVV